MIMLHVFVSIQPWCHQKTVEKNSPNTRTQQAKDTKRRKNKIPSFFFFFFCSYLDSEQQKVHVKVELGKNHLVGDSHEDTGRAVGHNTNGCRVG